jgi:DNA mismatch repair protein MutS2
LQPGQVVRTPLGKGVVREVRNNGRLLVVIRGRAVLLAAGDVAIDSDVSRAGRSRGTDVEAGRPSVPSAPAHLRIVDLHGLTVDEAAGRVDSALNDAILADAAEIRFVHGKGGGRIRTALHQRLRAIPAVRAFRLDPRNPGITIVSL